MIPPAPRIYLWWRQRVSIFPCRINWAAEGEGRGLVSFHAQAHEVFVSAGRSKDADTARAEVNRLFRAGNYAGARDKLEGFINSAGSGFTEESRSALRQRLDAIATSTGRQVVTVAQGGTGALLEKGPLAGAGQAEISAMGGTQPVNALLESYRADATGVAKDLESTSAPGGAAYRDVQGAELRLRQTPDTSQLAAKVLAQKTQETVGKATTKAPDGSDRPIRVTIVEDERQQPPAPIESPRRRIGERAEKAFGPGSGWHTLFGGD